ncbi:hypothetical protein C0J52_10147 [Blattella germanica]|nr:hypothetical protein C0J52_10147 [Blattella germanica]
MKYSGSRNYFNTKLKRCQKVPVCITDETKELPDVAYNPNSNTCKDLETDITEADLEILNGGKCEHSLDTEPIPHVTNIRCHHGRVDNMTGFCICDKGWTSIPDQFSPSTSLYHMCTVQIRHWHTLYNKEELYKLYMLGGSALLALLYAFCIFCCYTFCHVKEECVCEEEEDVCDCDDAEEEEDEDECLCYGDD